MTSGNYLIQNTKMPKLYITYRGTKYYGYDIDFVGLRTQPKDYARVYLGQDEYNAFRKGDISGFIKPVTVTPGSSVHLVPECTVAVDDVRREYKIKRKFDEGDYNVFSKLRWLPNISPNRDGIYLIPKHNAAVIVFGSSHTTADRNFCFVAYPDINDDDIICVEGFSRLFFSQPLANLNEESWENMVLGESEKPCISINDLVFNETNKLDVDALQLVYRLSKTDRHVQEGEYEKFNLQLKSLNQTNWRDYPLTMHMLFNELLNHQRYGTYANLKGKISTVPKAIKHFYNDVKEPVVYTKEDLELCQEFLMDLLGINGTMYVSGSALARKLKSINMEPEAFEKYFDCTMRIKIKNYDQN